MGKALQIRVSAVTWDEDLVEELWPRLSALAFNVPLKHEKHGVLEMVKALADGIQFMDWSEQQKTALAPGIEKASHLMKDLEQALADWEPRKANTLSDALEMQLDILDTLCR